MIANIVKNTIKRNLLIKQGDKILVGVSGGADSVCLLYLLKSLSKEFNLKLAIAHLDHMLRKDSALDAEFVRKLGLKLSIPVTIGKIDIKNLGAKGSTEEIARDARLKFLFETAKKIKADKIALAHNLDDQAETLLMRLIRGSGLFGLSGILPMKIIQGNKIIRPLIEVPRTEIDKYLKIRKIKSRLDKTNLEDIYLRNRLRNKLLPMLKKEYNPQITQALSNLAQSSSLDYDFLSRYSAKLIKEKFGSINLVKFRRLHPAIQRMILRLKVAKLQGSTRRITYQHIKEIEDLIIARPTNSIVDLPKGISVLKKAKTITFYRR
ncbi:MAG: tRNA lysidine(34) synthetase TilS [Candidatus Omnitrophica bacterium]|nr:tRNA lysidine(34) synthetase TilS [Candidatus Omnitrophota bacterium]